MRPMKRTFPLQPSSFEVTPWSVTSSPSLLMITSSWGEVKLALNVIRPGWLAVRWIVITLSAKEVMTSRS